MSTLSSRAVPVNLSLEPSPNGQDTSGEPTAAKPKGKRPRRKGGTPTTPRRRRRRRKIDAQAALLSAARFGPWCLAIIFLAVSMPHLAAGFERITGCSLVTGWLMAVAIDSAQVLCKLQLTISKRLALSVAPKLTSLGVILATTALSMTLNVLAFLEHVHDDVGTVLAWVAGLMLPLFILGLSYSGSAFCLAKPARRKRR